MAENTFAIAGLGNPGNQYRDNRHNAGFLLLDYLESLWNGGMRSKKSGAEFQKISITAGKNDIDLVLIWPQKFMNLSGAPVCDLLKFFKISPENLIVLHDEIELSFGDVRSKKGGGHKGHNGLRDIISHCGTSDFNRIRFGVGRPERGDVASYVLSNFNEEEKNQIPDMFKKAEKEIMQLLIKMIN